MHFPYVPTGLYVWLYKHVCPFLYTRNSVSVCYEYVPVFSHRLQQMDVCKPACSCSIHRSFFRPGWSGVLAEEVGSEFKPEAPGIGAKSVEQGEEVLGAEDGVSQREGQGRWDYTPAILHHPCVWPPFHSCCLTRPVHHCLPWGTRSTHIRSLPLPFHCCHLPGPRAV